MTLPLTSHIPAVAPKPTEPNASTPVTSQEMSTHFTDAVFEYFASLHHRRMEKMRAACSCFEEIQNGDFTPEKMKELLEEGMAAINDSREFAQEINRYNIKLRCIREEMGLPVPKKSTIVTAVLPRNLQKSYASAFVRAQIAEERAQNRISIMTDSQEYTGTLWRS